MAEKQKVFIKLARRGPSGPFLLAPAPFKTVPTSFIIDITKWLSTNCSLVLEFNLNGPDYLETPIDGPYM